MSFWACFLIETYARLRPLRRTAAWLTREGLKVSPGTLADRIPHFQRLFDPIQQVIAEHLNELIVCHGDETSWRVQDFAWDQGKVRAWLWLGVGEDCTYFLVDPSRSAEAAQRLFRQAKEGTILVYDRYSAYKRLARLHSDQIILAWCWVQVRRDFIKCWKRDQRLEAGKETWLERLAELYRLNHRRLKAYDRRDDLDQQSDEFQQVHHQLKTALDQVFSQAKEGSEELAEEALERGPLESLLNRQEGLRKFWENPRVPMDNHLTEWTLRGAAIFRRLTFGSDSQAGAAFSTTRYLTVNTLEMNGLDAGKWLNEWLAACAVHHGQPPKDLGPWLPWLMSSERFSHFRL